MQHSSHPDPSGSVTHFVSQLRTGSNSAAAELWQRYFPRLISLAEKTLAGRPQRVADADDAVQSAFASFCHRLQSGQFDVADREDLWNLLGTITANKARAQGRREGAAKRGGGRVLGEDALGRSDSLPLNLDQAMGSLPTAEFDLYCEEMLSELPAELREFAVLRLLGYRNAEIARIYDCTERKVERKMNLLRLRWRSMLDQERKS